MIILYDTAHNKICGLTNYSDLYVEQATGSNSSSDSIILDQLHFKYPLEDPRNKLIDYECYIGTEEAEYIVKEINFQTSENSGITWVEYVCDLNIEPLKGTLVDSFAPGSTTAENCTNLALAGTGWIVGYSDVTKSRTAAMKNSTVWEILLQIANLYNCDITFNTVKKEVNINQKLGADRGAYFAEQLNLKQLEVQGNTRSYVTRLYPVGKDGLSISGVNNGQKFVSNYQYSPKVISAYWVDNRYTVAQDLMDDAVERLDFLSKPTRSYSVDIIDLAKISDKWSLLDFKIGDFVTIISQSTGVKEKLRIVKIDRYFDEPEKSTAELSNKIASLDDIILRVSDAADTVDNATDSTGDIQGSNVSVTNKDGTFSTLNTAVAKIGEVIATKVDTTQLDAINADIKNLQADKVDTTYLQANYITTDSIKANYATIDNLNSATARIGTLETTTAHITNGIIDNATIDAAKVNNLSATYATIQNLSAATANISTLQTDVGNIQNLLTGNLTAANFQAGAIQAGSAVIANEAISSAQIISLDVGKINAGTISTTKFTLQSDSGNMLMSDNTIQIKDASRVRVQIGKDASNDYNMYVWDASGNLMFDATGLKADGIKDKIIRDDMVSDTANINGSKIEKESLIVQINGATTNLKSSKIYLDTQAQTLDVAFNSLNNVVISQGQTVSSQGTQITTIQGQISNKIWQTDITTALDNQQLGVRNLITNSSDCSCFVPCNYQGADWTLTTINAVGENGVSKNVRRVVRTTGGGDFRIQQSNAVGALGGRTFTFSVWVKSNTSSNQSVAFMMADDLDGNYVGFPVITIYPDKWVRYICTLTYNGSDTRNYVRIYGTASTVSADILLSDCKLEEGTKPTDYTEAPEDTQSQITTINSNYSSLNQTVSGISANVSSLQTTTSNLGTRMSAAESSITQNANQIATKVSQTQVDNSIASSKQIPDTRNDNQPPSWYWSTYPKQVVNEFKFRNVVGAPGSANYGNLTTIVQWCDSSGSPITQEFKSNDGLFRRYSASDSSWSSWEQIENTAGSQAKVDYLNQNTVTPLANRMSSAESSITQQANQIAAKVNTSDFGSLMEQNAAAFKWSFNNIDSASMQFDSNGLHVYKGSITGPSISGSTITGGTISGTTLNGVTINGANITASNSMTIQANNWGSTITTGLYFGNVQSGYGNQSSIVGSQYNDGTTTMDITTNNTLRLICNTVLAIHPNGSPSNVWTGDLFTENIYFQTNGSTSKIDCAPYSNYSCMRLLSDDSNGIRTYGGETDFISGGSLVAWVNYAGAIHGSSKSAVTNTVDYGQVITYSDESPNHVFNDRGRGKLDSTGSCTIIIDPEFAETVNTKDGNYHVQLTGIKTTNIYVDDLQADYFVVKGEPGKEFFWMITAERYGYEGLRFNDADLDV